MIKLEENKLYLTFLDEHTSAFLVLNNEYWFPPRKLPNTRLLFYRPESAIELRTRRSCFLK